MLEGDPVLLARPRERVLGQEIDVVPQVPQRREGQGDHGQPMVQILAEALGAHRRPKVLVRRADDPDVEGFAAGRSQSPDTAVLQDLQQLRLKGQGQQPHLVEEQGAAVGDLEQPGL
jgi:hypothetical protein